MSRPLIYLLTLVIFQHIEEELESLKVEKGELLDDLKQVESILEPTDVKQLHAHEQTFDRDYAASSECLEKEKKKYVCVLLLVNLV